MTTQSSLYCTCDKQTLAAHDFVSPFPNMAVALFLCTNCGGAAFDENEFSLDWFYDYGDQDAIKNLEGILRPQVHGARIAINDQVFKNLVDSGYWMLASLLAVTAVAVPVLIHEVISK